MAALFDDVKVNDRVTIHDRNGYLLATGYVYSRTKTTFDVNGAGGGFGGRYRLDGRRQKESGTYGDFKGGFTYARPADPGKIKLAEDELDKRAAEEDRQEEIKKKAEFDALPENIKLARKASFAFNVAGERQWYNMPIDTLRAIVTYAEANGIETE